MLEPLVSSRIRRALIEHLLAHPAERFYLRGLAKQLDLSISPLRRELKRLEEAGVLKAADEGAMRFYLVDQTSPLFRQLHQTVQPLPAAAPGVVSVAPLVLSASSVDPAIGPRPLAVDPLALLQRRGGRDVAPRGAQVRGPRALPVGLQRTRQAMRRARPWPILVGTAGLSLGLVIAVGMAAYVTATNRRLASLAETAVTRSRAPISVVHEPPRASGAMSSGRWQLMPGTMGGFSSSSASESY